MPRRSLGSAASFSLLSGLVSAALVSAACKGPTSSAAGEDQGPDATTEAATDAPEDGAVVEPDAVTELDGGPDATDSGREPDRPDAGGPCAPDGGCAKGLGCFYAFDASCSATPTSGRCEWVPSGHCKPYPWCDCTGHTVTGCGSDVTGWTYPTPIDHPGACASDAGREASGADAGHHGTRRDEAPGRDGRPSE